MHSVYQTIQFFIQSKISVLYVTVLKHSLRDFCATKYN